MKYITASSGDGLARILDKENLIALGSPIVLDGELVQPAVWPGHIVQMLPAHGVTAVYDDNGEKLRYPVHLWGLSPDGDVIPLTFDDSGYMDDARSCNNFVGLEFETDSVGVIS
jgi:hypothetical protein